MEQLMAIGVGAGFFLLMWTVVIPRMAPTRAAGRTRQIIDRIAAGASGGAKKDHLVEDDETLVANFTKDVKGLGKLLLLLPKGEETYLLMLKSGHGQQVKEVLLGIAGLFVAVSAILFPVFGLASVLIALLLVYIVPRKVFRYEIHKRNMAFIDAFPEAIDMIVRSVKSGHPLNTALRMIADNMEAPIGPEFRQVVNEVSYGRPLVEALRRLSKRIDEPDVHFFVVVLAVQQETGGNLAEILSNLSNVIRGRKQLFQKIRAMTSEGRATAWVLGSLPVIQLGAIQATSPKYLEPLYYTLQGNVILAIAMGLIALAVWIVMQMINVDV